MTANTCYLNYKHTGFLYPESLVIYHGGAARTTFLGMLKFAMLMGAVFVVVIIAPALYRSGEPLWKPAAGM